jgi:glycosyltransferase involved in cell wall biosynthesis
MTRRKISVHHWSPGSAVGYGALDSILLVRRMAIELGFDSELFVDGDEAAWSSPVRRASELQPHADDLVLIHHCGYQERLEWLAGLRCRKALVYHGLTPPRYFSRDNRGRLRSITAHAQLASLRGFVEAAIALSRPAADRLRQRGFPQISAMPLFKDWSDLRSTGYLNPVEPNRRAVFRIINIGQIAADNHQRDLVRLVGQIGTIGGMPCELILIGAGEPDWRYQAELERDIRGAGLGDRIVVADGVGQDALTGYCRTANVYLSLSERDTAASSIFAAMTLDLPVVAYAAPGIADLLGDTAMLVHGRDPATLRDALYRVHQDRRFRRELIARQREAACGGRSDRVRQDFRQWLLAMGDFESRSFGARLLGWRAPTSGVCGDVAPANGPPGFAASAPPVGAVRYIIEAPMQSAWPLQSADRQLALALGRLPERAVSIGTAEAAKMSPGEVTARPPTAALDDSIVRSPGGAERIVTIRRSHPPSPIGMLGDVRLLQVTEAESTIAPPLAGLINLHLDAVLVASHFAERTVRNSGISLPIVVVGRGADDATGSRAEQCAARGPVSGAAPFTYLYLDCALVASSVEEVLTAYSLAFTSADPVLLVISAADQVQAVIDVWVRRLAGGFFSPPVQILPEALTAADSELLYRLADAVILPILGEEFNPAAAALAYGLPLIAAGLGGHLDYCDAENATLIDYAFDVSADTVDPPARPRVLLSVPGLIAAMKAAYRDGRDHDTPTARRARRGRTDSAGLRWAGVAKKIDDFVVSLDKRPVMNRKIRLAWISTYNTRCGLATHSEHLLEHFDREMFDVTVIGNHQEPLKPDPPILVRLWPDRSGSLASVREFIRTFDAIFVNFHFSLMEIHDLAETLRTARAAGIDTYVTLHKTMETVIGGRAVSLNEIAEALRASTRLIVHTEADIAQLKSFGIVDNVVMIPPGVIDQPALNTATVRSLLGLQQFHPIVGTFGFLLPPKGLQQLIHAFALVLRHFPAAMLMMLNAEFPGAAGSAEERECCRALIRELGLDDRIRLIDEFLETDEILLLLNACDMTVFSYQSSSESDSGAVRLGLAAGRPVATTPLAVFANLSGIVHQFAGKTATDIAEGIVALLRAPDLAARLVQQQQDWIGRNSWAAQAVRIGNIMRGCFEARHAVELRPPASSGLDPAGVATDAERAASVAPALREIIGLVETAGESAQPPGPAAPDATAIGAAEGRARQAL